MAENLLWPTKLSMPPQLLIDPSELFNGDVFANNIPLVNSNGSEPIRIRFIDMIQDGFRIGYVGNVFHISTLHEYGVKRLMLPFQEIFATIDEFKCHGWNSSGIDILSTPYRTEVKKSISHRMGINISAMPANKWDPDYKPLFKMKGDTLEGDGSGAQFSSKGTYSGIMFNIDGDELITYLPSEFPDMWSAFSDQNSKTLAFEVIVDVHVVSAIDSDGFKIGVVSS